MGDAQTGQVVATAAEVYDEFFLPALFEQWAGQVCDAAMVGAGHSVLDVACGTGVLARAARQRVGPTGGVVGVDINDGMLAVARRNEPAIDWQQGAAEQLGFDDDRFDAVVCQFGLMFFADRVAALASTAARTKRCSPTSPNGAPRHWPTAACSRLRRVAGSSSASATAARSSPASVGESSR
jgi:ubiquinone/menaquinone biosynthesis C-methylase UbiE